MIGVAAGMSGMMGSSLFSGGISGFNSGAGAQAGNLNIDAGAGPSQGPQANLDVLMGILMAAAASGGGDDEDSGLGATMLILLLGAMTQASSQVFNDALDAGGGAMGGELGGAGMMLDVSV